MKKHFYVACEAANTNPGFEHYFRLYVQKNGDIPKLLEQGLPELIDGWESKYGATFQVENPYPEFD